MRHFSQWSWQQCSHRDDYRSAAEHEQECPAHGRDAVDAVLLQMARSVEPVGGVAGVAAAAIMELSRAGRPAAARQLMAELLVVIHEGRVAAL